jgi:putative sterol carrier protein
MALFPSADWTKALMDKLNHDERYAQIARNWEGDLIFLIDINKESGVSIQLYVDLWHGKCRDAFIVNENQKILAAFILKAPYENYVRLLKGQLDPMQALLTRKLSVQGNMAILMRSVPTVLDFVRCCREVTTDFI